MYREAPRGSRPVAVAIVAVVSLLTGWGVFQLVNRADASNDSKNGSANAAHASKAPGVRGGRSGKGRRVAANGHQLWATPPLGSIHQDQGSSVALPDGRTLWIFADTFQRSVRPKFFITSAAAVSNPGFWQLQYSTDRTGIPTEFMPRTPPELADRKPGVNYEAVWPTGNTQLPDGRIIIAYAKYKVLLKKKNFVFLGAGLFQYRYTNVKALLNGGHADRIASDIWTAADGEVRSPIYANGYVYFSQCQNLRCYALRTTPAKLADRSSYRWWTGSGWSSSSFDRQSMQVASNHPGGNASVVRLNSGIYAMADTEAGSVSTTGLLWVSPHPWGPWSAAASFTFPRCPPPGCYGLNIHPADSTSNLIRVSYATTGVGPFVRLYDVPVSISSDGSYIRVR
jgi:hypothetical protein